MVNEGMLIAVPLDGSTELTIGVSGEIFETIEKSYLPSDTVYGIPGYTKSAFDIEDYCWKEALESNLLGITSGYVNTTLTREHFEVLEKAFANQIIFLSSPNLFVNASKNGDAWEIQFNHLDLALGTAIARQTKAKFIWSDTDNCVQRSVSNDLNFRLMTS